jgi:hypothetical protein
MQNGYGNVPNSSQNASGSTFGQFGSNPQMVQQHISEDLHSGGYPTSSYQGAYNTGNYSGQGGSTFGQYGTDPQVVRQHIQQDLGNTQGNSQGQGQGQGYNQQAYSQMNQNQNQNQNQSNYNQMNQNQGYASQGQSGYGYGNSTLSQYGTNPQMVQQHIRSDLAYGQGSMSSQQAGSYRPNYDTQGYGQNGYSNQSGGQTFAQFGTDPQVVRQHISQDLQGTGSYSQMGQSPQNQGSGGMGMSQGQGYSQSQGYSMMGPNAVGATNPQIVRQHIAQDLGGYNNNNTSGQFPQYR